MIINYIKNILKNHRKGISLEKLQELLAKKNIKEPVRDIIQKSELFKLYSGMVFLKSTLTKCKKDFLQEFEDYLQGKISNKKLRNDITNNFLITIPDVLFINWLDISLDRKLLIFEMLFNMLIKPKYLRNKLKIYFNDLIEFYSTLVLYSILLYRNYENNFYIIIKILDDIEPYETILRNQLFALLTNPESIKKKINIYEKELINTEDKLRTIIKKSFFSILNYSPNLLKRVINNELKDFDFSSLLSRFEYNHYFDFITSIIATKTDQNHNLFKDLGL